MSSLRTLGAWGACVLLALLVGGLGHASLLADRFGVSPTLIQVSDWEYASGQFYSGYRFDTSSLAPTRNLSTADYAVNDWFGQWSNAAVIDHVDYSGTGTYPQGCEPYDVEALYFDDDGRNLYISIITSVPTPANGIFVETREGLNNPVVQGDIALDLGLSGSQQDSHGFTYNYGVDIVDEVKPSSGNVTGLATDTVGTGVYRTTGTTLQNGAWYLGTPTGAVTPPSDGARTNFDPSATPGDVSYLGAATTSWTKLNLYYGANEVQENNWDTWLIEATVPLNLLPRFNPGQALAMMFLPGCRNDGNPDNIYLDLHGDLDMPEPGTYVLMGLGLAVLVYRLRRRTA